MGTDQRKRQKKLERRSAKRKEKKHLTVREQSVGLAERIANASKFPILRCWITSSLDSTGIASIGLSRELPNGMVAVATFLVDRFCLGVKDAWGVIADRSTYESKFMREAAREVDLVDMPPADARKLLEGAVAYARSLGLPPHPDYAQFVKLFGDVNAADSNAVFEFGKNGRPFFIPGPYDSPERVRQVMSILNKNGDRPVDFVQALASPELDAIAPARRGQGHFIRLESGQEVEILDDAEDFQ